MEKKQQHTHTVMSKKLADALMEAGVQHFSEGGSPGVSGQNSVGGPGREHAESLGIGGYGGDALAGWDQAFGFNNYNAQAPNIAFQPELRDRIKRETMLQYGVGSEQHGLANQLLNQSMGYGPNPAQEQLRQQTGQNVQQQAALMAGQRGASSNPALMARQAALQGANTQQQAVGQSATLQANQQLAAQQALAQQQQNIMQNSLQAQNIASGAIAAENTAYTQGQLGTDQINANTSGQNAQNAGGIFSGVLNNGMSMMMMKDGGEVPYPVKKYAGGGLISYDAPQIQTAGLTPFQAFDFDHTSKKMGTGSTKPKGGAGGAKEGGGPMGGGGEEGGSIAGAAGPDSSGGMEESSGGMMGGMLKKLMGGDGGGMGMFGGMMSAGGSVPGQAAVKGNSDDNDKVPALLSPGEIVLPRTVTQSPDMERKAIEFLRHLKGKKQGYSEVVDSRKKKMACGGRV